MTETKIKKLKTKVKWSKVKAIKELVRAIKFLTNLDKKFNFNKENLSEYAIEFEMNTLISSKYLMDRQFQYLLPKLEFNEEAWFDFKELYDEEKIKDAVMKNLDSQNLTKTNMFGLYIDNNGLPIKDATCPGYFKIWEKKYYSNFDSELRFLMDMVSMHYFDGTEYFSTANKEITKYMKELEDKYITYKERKLINDNSNLSLLK